MLGGRTSTGNFGIVTQAAFVRSLLSSYFRNMRFGIGGLFNAPLPSASGQVLQWHRIQQIAFILFLWQRIENAVKNSTCDWAEDLREEKKPVQIDLPFSTIKLDQIDQAFAGSNSLISSDQGLRAILGVTNDVLFYNSPELDLNKWKFDYREDDEFSNAIIAANKDIEEQESITTIIDQISRGIAQFDWRMSSTPSLPRKIRMQQAAYRGSSGYRLLKENLLFHLTDSNYKTISESAKRISKLLGYE